jgi:hypothetical protein
MATSGDYFSEEKNYQPANTVAEIRDRFVASGLPCDLEQDGDKVKLRFEGRKCYLAFTVNDAGRPLTASMPNTEDYDAEIAQVVFSVFESMGWKFRP